MAIIRPNIAALALAKRRRYKPVAPDNPPGIVYDDELPAPAWVVLLVGRLLDNRNIIVADRPKEDA